MRAFSGILCIEGEPTSDGRTIEPGALWWPDEPIPLYLVPGAPVVGKIERIWRDENVVRCSGSVDDDDCVPGIPEFKADPENPGGFGLAIEVEVGKWRIAGELFVDDDVRFILEDGRIRGVSIVPFPAFVQARAEFE